MICHEVWIPGSLFTTIAVNFVNQWISESRWLSSDVSSTICPLGYYQQLHCTLRNFIYFVAWNGEVLCLYRRSLHLKVPNSIIQNWGFLCVLMILLQRSKFKISLQSVKKTKQNKKTIWMCEETLSLFTAICPRKYVLGIKIAAGNEKNMGHLLILTYHRVFKKLKK